MTTTCRSCAHGTCPSGHVYALEVRRPDGSLTYVVGQTGKTVEERYQDYFDPDRYRTPISRFVREAGPANLRIAVELFADRNPVASAGDKNALEDAEARLAEDLRARGLAVRSNMLGKRPM
jgi:hypothetical protein